MGAAVLAASPRLVEPVYSLDVAVPLACVGAVYRVLGARRGRVVNVEAASDSGQDSEGGQVLEGYIPVSASIGLTADLRQETSGRAFHNQRFDHWSTLPSECLTEGTQANTLAASIRNRKGMLAAFPSAESLCDRL